MADISPELAARIEQLKSSHHENPARFFMPLASAYREAGEQARAEELLRDNLKRHPGYLSAHVLLGRCLADRGVVDEARNEFQYVLSIDSQNLIALRTLGEMAAASGNRDEARRWYGDLLAVDPMNSEARHALDALEVAPAASEPAWDPYGHGLSADPAPAPAPEPVADMEPLDFDAPRLEPAPELGFGAVSLPADDDATRGWGEVELDAAPPAPQQDNAGFDAMDFGSVDLNQPEVTWTDAPADAEPLADPSAGWGVTDEEPAPLLELRSFDEDAAADDVEVVTETMAELLYRQGFVDRAAEMYRELISRRGSEPALVQRLQQIEMELRGGADAAPEFVVEGTMAVAQDEAPSWLEAVDAHAAETPAEGVIDLMDVPDFPAPEAVETFEVETAASFDDIEVASEVGAGFGDVAATTHAAASDDFSDAGATGDVFADSFANGFEADTQPSEAAPTFDAAAFDAAAVDPPLFGAPLFDLPSDEPLFDAPSADAVPSFDEQPTPFFDAPVEPEHDRAEWSAPTVEPTAPVAGMMDDFAAPTEQPAAEPAESITSYLWSIMAWRPGQQAEQDAGAPPRAEAWDEETLGAPEQQPPLDEPWMAAAAGEAELTHSTESDDEPWAVPFASTEELLPADQTTAIVDELPWMAEEEPATQAEVAPLEDFVPFDLPPVEPAGTEAAGSAAPDEAMPWEGELDLPDPFGGVPQVEVPTADVAPPAGGFSFEDFFSEPQAPAAAPLPEAAPPAPEPAAPAARADEDEDLESFQAWLQSLKR